MERSFVNAFVKNAVPVQSDFPFSNGVCGEYPAEVEDDQKQVL